MISTPTKEQLIALEQLAKLPRWTDVNKLIEAEIAVALDRLLGAKTDADLHYLRGYIMALKEFQKTVAQAPGILAKQGINSPL